MLKDLFGFFEKVFGEDITKWLKADANWTILAPICVLVLLAVYYLRPFLRLQKSLQRLAENWRSFMWAGGICCVIAITYALFRRDMYHLLIGSAPLLLLGLIFLCVGLWHKPRGLPEDKIVVAVALFREVSEKAKDDAMEARDALIDELRERQKNGAPLEVLDPDCSIEGDSPDARRQNAVSQFRDKAHLVIWGKVRKVGNSKRVTTWWAVATQPQNVVLDDPGERVFSKIAEPDHGEFDLEFSRNAADVPFFIHGFALRKQRRWDEAIEKFGYVHSWEGWFYTGLCNYEEAEVSRTPRQYLEKAVGSYHKAAEMRTEDAFPWYWAMTQNNLGSALCNLGSRMGGEEGRKLLDEAIACADRSLSVYDAMNFPWHYQAATATRERAVRELEALRSQSSHK